jgi:hypothetical protein
MLGVNLRRSICILVLWLYAHIAGAAGSSPGEKAVVVLFDLSGSASTDQTREEYLQTFDQVIRTIRPGDVLLADGITGTSLTESFPAVREEFDLLPEFNAFVDNRLEYKRRVKAMRERMKERLMAARGGVENMLKRPATRSQTEILSALLAAERGFSSFPRPRKVLVLASDMVEESALANFASSAPPPGLGRQMVEKHRKAGVLPDLTGVRVCAAGAKAETSDRFFAIKSFWQDYVSGCGASLEDRDYGRTLLQPPQ